MKFSKSKEIYRLAIVFILFIIFSSSCKKEVEVLPDYVGTWSVVENIPLAAGFTSIREVITFSADSVIDLMQIPRSSIDNWADYMNLKGSISVNGNIMTVNITEIGMSSLDPITRMPTGTLISYKETGPEFESILAAGEQPKVFETEYTVSGNKLTLKTDNNNDGDYLDADEITVYTKQ